MNLMASEAIAMVNPVPGAPSQAGWLLVTALFLATLAAAFLGTWLGVRMLTVGRLRQKDGWREVAYRFRSEEPMSVGKDMIQRMSGVLDEIEDLGKKLGGGRNREEPPPADAIRPPVTFARRDGLEVTSVAIPAVAATVDPPTGQTPRPLVRGREAGQDRATRYGRARALLAEGRDRDEVRALTGLKGAELDLLRCAPGVAA
jgi:hypothetical protein